ncbi:TetR/AcrR family transcriptional regulator [Nocardiopsis salina]|uniref:TetR/AcrR family transcriptional regulator n=1 Tax=Nocardiopsis salina TaxID=245836 RepID=UPI00035DE436
MRDMSADPESTDHRRRPRRRGEALVAAILEATIAELEDHGYAALTMEKVAERAKASKASLYRRWPTRAELVLDAAYSIAPRPEIVPDGGSLREDLLYVLRRTAVTLSGPAGEALRGLMAEILPDPERTREVRAHTQGLGRQTMGEVVQRAVERGEIEPAAVRPRRLDVGQALLRNHFLFHHEPIQDAMIVEIVDTVLLPLFRSVPEEGGAGT